MDPVELFRLRCLREAEEKFRQGLVNMGSNVPEMAVGRQRDDRVSQESQSSYVSAVEPSNVQVVSQEPVLLRAACNPGIQNPQNVVSQNVVSVVTEPFVPKPPPIPPALPPFPPSVSGTMQNSGGFGENPSENLRTVDLPKLSMDATALQFGDWLSIIDSLMGDLSYTSGDWWMMIRRAVDQSYMDWLNAGPIDRLRLRPQVDSRVQCWPRTEKGPVNAFGSHPRSNQRRGHFLSEVVDGPSAV